MEPGIADSWHGFQHFSPTPFHFVFKWKAFALKPISSLAHLVLLVTVLVSLDSFMVKKLLQPLQIKAIL